MKYLALGDSYTIGELVPYELNFPSQVVAQLHHKGVKLELDKLIAVTGWTTDELATGIYEQQPKPNYDWVTLLIGVNNQYRERSAHEYAVQFYSLLCQALYFVQNKPEHIIVLSIPDWGMTPFNTERDIELTSKEIDELNKLNKEISLHLGVHYLNITESTRTHSKDTDYLASDLLHYSAKEYAIWADAVANIIYNETQAELALQAAK
jgi:lysophospholipase L1-like esterase